jgi:hypothetical protein
MKNCWSGIDLMIKFANKKIKENPDITDAWFTFDETTDIHIEQMDDVPVRSLQAIAYPVDKKGQTIVNSTYIQLF